MKFVIFMLTALVCLFASIVMSLAAPLGQEDRDRAEDAAVRAAMEKGAKEADVLVSFFGKIVDQNDNPVENAEVKIGLKHYDPNQPDKLFSAIKSIIFKTDKSGLFSVKSEKGRELYIGSISKDGYEFVFSENQNRGFDYQLNHTDRHIPDEAKPVVFHLRKIGLTTFLLEKNNQEIEIRPDGKAIVVEIFKNRNYYAPDNNKLFPGFAVSATLSKDTRNWVLTFKGKHEGDTVVMLDRLIYEAPAPEAGYLPSTEVKVTLQPNEILGREPIYPHEIEVYLIVQSAKPKVFTRVKLRIFPREEEKCIITYDMTVNPYGERTFEYAKAIDKYWDVRMFLQKEAIHALCNGELPPKPNIEKLIEQAKAEKEAKQKSESH